MTTQEDVKEAERGFIISILTNKAIMTALVAAIVTLLSYVAYRFNQPTQTLGADADPCCSVQKAAQGKGSVTTNSLAKVLMLGCAMSACKPIAPPNPAPVPTVVVDAGQPTPSVVYPLCKPGLMAPHYSVDQIEKWRGTVKVRHAIERPQGLLLAPVVAPTTMVMWQSNQPFACDQGPVGQCVSGTALDWWTTSPSTGYFTTASLCNSTMLTAYEWITNNDQYPGAWPKQDTGSDILTGCKWLVSKGYAKGCQPLYSLEQVKVALLTSSVMTGIDWRANMYTPNSCGHLDVSGAVDGGHAELLGGRNDATDEWWLQNHWGNAWGVCIGEHCGYHALTTKEYQSLNPDFVQVIR